MNKRWRNLGLKALLASVAFAVLQLNATAEEIDWTKEDYSLYINNDNTQVLIKPNPRIIILHGEIATPIDISTESYLMASPGAELQIYTQHFDASQWTESYEVFSGDFNNDGDADAVIQPATATTGSGNSFVILGKETGGAQVQVIGPASHGILMSADQGTLTVSQIPGDSIDDLTFSSFQGYQIAFKGSPSGLTGEGSGITVPGYVNSLEISGDQAAVIFTYSPSDSNESAPAWNCSQNGQYFVTKGNVMFKEIFFQLLTSYRARTSLQVNVSGCSTNGMPNASFVKVVRD